MLIDSSSLEYSNLLPLVRVCHRPPKSGERLESCSRTSLKADFYDLPA